MRNNIIFNKVKDNANDFIVIRFFIPKSKKNPILGFFLCGLLEFTCKSGFYKKVHELQNFYNVKNFYSFYTLKNYDTLSINYLILNSRYINEKDYFENVIQYLYNDIFNHLQYFTEESVQKIKDMMISKVKETLSLPDYYLDVALNKELNRKLDNYYNKNTIKNIKSITLDQLKEYYLNMLKCNYSLVFNGEVNKQKKDIINTFFDHFKVRINPIYYKLKKQNLVKVEDTQKVGQSGFTLIYYVDNFKSCTRNYLIVNLFANLLQDIGLMKHIREEMNLCYSIYDDYDLRKNYFCIKCYCSKKRINEGIEAVKKEFENILDIFTKDYFLAQKKSLMNLYESQYDYIISLSNLFYRSLYKDLEKNPSKIIDEIKTINLEEVIDFANHLILIGEYHLLGEK